MWEKPKRYPENTPARTAFIAHTLLYGIGWVVAFLTVISPYTAHIYPPLFMIWTVLYLMHLAAYYRSMSSTTAGTIDERQIYREAYHDAMRQIRREQDEDHRLMIDDDGELGELYAAEKMKRRE